MAKPVPQYPVAIKQTSDAQAPTVDPKPESFSERVDDTFMGPWKIAAGVALAVGAVGLILRLRKKKGR
jgi:hypothetical protein